MADGRFIDYARRASNRSRLARRLIALGIFTAIPFAIIYVRHARLSLLQFLLLFFAGGAILGTAFVSGMIVAIDWLLHRPLARRPERSEASANALPEDQG